MVIDFGFGKYMMMIVGSMLNMFVYILLLMIGIVGLLYVIMRFFMVLKVFDVCIFVGWVLIFIVIFYMMVFVVVVMVKMNLIGMINVVVMKGGDIYVVELSLVVEECLDWMKCWEKIGLLKFEDKNGDGCI